MRAGCSRAVAQLLSAGEDAQRGGRKYLTESGRLPHRYSLGTCSASRHMLHDPAWAEHTCTTTTGPILSRLLGSPDFAVKGAGGDLCLPGAIEYQHLHRVRRPPAPAAALRLLTSSSTRSFCCILLCSPPHLLHATGRRLLRQALRPRRRPDRPAAPRRGGGARHRLSHAVGERLRHDTAGERTDGRKPGHQLHPLGLDCGERADQTGPSSPSPSAPSCPLVLLPLLLRLLLVS